MKHNETKEATVEVASFDEDKKDILVISLGDSFVFDGVEIKELNLDGLMELTAEDLCSIDRQMMMMGYTGRNMEITRQYAMLVAAKTNKKPWEFCNGMKARDTVRLNNVVTAFFYARG